MRDLPVVHPLSITIMKKIVIFVFGLSLFFGCRPKPPVDILVHLDSLAFLEPTVNMSVNDSLSLPVALFPENATDTLLWSSSNEKVLIVDQTGKLKAIARGYSYVEVSKGSIKDKCLVNVSQDLLPYSLVWTEEFNGPDLDQSIWNIETGGGGWGNQEKQNYTSRTENLRIQDGKLIIQARKEVYNSSAYTSARINTKKKFSAGYGRVEARISLPSGAGTWPAYWMMGANYDIAKWPLCGEIDIMEHVGSQPRLVSNALHTSDNNGSKGNNWYARAYFDSLEHNFHVYAIEKEEKFENGDDCLKFYFDNRLLATVWEPHANETLKNWPFKQEFFVILNLAIGGTMGGTVNDAIFDQDVIMEVDYVRYLTRK